MKIVMNLKLVTLDVTNTILRFSALPSYHYSKVANLYGVSFNQEKLETVFRHVFKAQNAKSPNFGVNDKGWFSWWSEVIKETIALSRETNVDASNLDKISRDLIQLYSTSEAYEIVSGFIPLVEYLSSRGVVIGAVSNTDERLTDILVHLGIFHHFHFVLTSYSAKALKPHPRIFDCALKRSQSNASPSEALHVGDSLVIDYLGAKRARWNSILVAADFKEQCREAGVEIEPHSMVSSLNDIVKTLEKFYFPIFGALHEEKEEEDEVMMMMKYAILASKRGDDAKVERLLHVTLKAVQEMDDQNAVTNIYDLMANFAFKNGQYKKAEKLSIDVLKRLLQGGKADDDNAVVEISLKLATIYCHLEDLEKAAQGFQFCIGTQESKLKAQGEENVDEDTLVLWAMSHDWYARFLLSLCHYDRAKEHFLRAYDVCIKVKGPEDPQTAILLNDLGSVCSLMQKYDEAVSYLKEAIRVGKLCGSEDLASFYVILGTTYMQKVFEKAEKYCQKGMRVAKAYKNDEAASESSLCLNTLKKLKSG